MAGCYSNMVTTKATSPPFFSSAHRKVINSPSIPTNCCTISTFNQHFRQSIMASMTFGDGNINSGNITDSFNTTVYKSDKDAEIMRWLSPLEPKNRHHSVRTGRLGSVGEWLLETSEFREWKGGKDRADKAVLFCSGGPGVGKTYLR